MNKRIIFLVCIIMFSVPFLGAENIVDLFAPIFYHNTSKIKLGQIKGQKLKGRFDGMGVIKLKNGDIYFGDISDGKPNGNGVLVCDGNNHLIGNEDAKLYIGRFKNGAKTKGKCLDSDSELIYCGTIIDDKPVSSDIQDEEYLGYFDYIKTDDNKWVYIGEITQGIPHGKGILIFNNGDYIISEFNNGERIGIGLYMTSEGEWQTEKCNNNNCIVMSSSSYYAQIDAERNRQVKAHLSDALSYFGQALTYSGEIVSQVNSIRNGSAGSSGITSDFSNGAEVQSGSNSYQSMYANWERRAEKNYNSITNLGYSVSNKKGEKSGSAGQGMSGGNYVMMKKSFREAQKQMRSIRQKAAKEGIQITQSKWETATISY